MPTAPGTKRRKVGQECDSESSYHLFMLITGSSVVPVQPHGTLAKQTTTLLMSLSFRDYVALRLAVLRALSRSVYL